MDLKLGTDHDLAIENNDLVLVDGLDAIAQDLRCRLQFFLGEWFLDQRIGMPYFQQILGAKPRLPVIKEIFRKAIMSTPGVLGLNDLSVDYEGTGRSISVAFKARTDTGILTFEEELII